MSPETLIALFTLAATAAFTPGPNNALVASSAATYGFARTIPHILGITLGFPVMIFCIGMFLGGIFQQSPFFREALRIVGALVLLWVAWRTATSGTSGKPEDRRPFTFVEAAAFQWVNPKGWAFSVAVTSQFVTPAAPMATALICAGVFGVAGLGSGSVWALSGQMLQRLLNTEFRLRMFNIAMGILIASSVVFLFLG